MRADPPDSLVLRCDDRCDSDCPLLGCCFKKHTEEVSRLVRRTSRELDQAPMITALTGL